MENSSVSIMPDLQSSLLCDDVRQESNGKFMLIGLFDAIASPQLPIVYPRLFTVSRWCSGEGSFTQHTRILKPDMQTPLVAGQPLLVNLPNVEGSATNVELFMNVTFDEVGTYWVETSLDDALKLRYPLRVGLMTPKQQEG